MNQARRKALSVLTLLFSATCGLAGCSSDPEEIVSECTTIGCPCETSEECAPGLTCDLFTGTCAGPVVTPDTGVNDTTVDDVEEDTEQDTGPLDIRPTDLNTDDVPQEIAGPIVALFVACEEQCAAGAACDPPFDAEVCAEICSAIEAFLGEVDLQDVAGCEPALTPLLECMQSADTCSEFVGVFSAEDNLGVCDEAFGQVEGACLGGNDAEEEGSGTAPEEGSGAAEGSAE